MNRLEPRWPALASAITLLFPLALWMLLWSGLQSGSIEDITHSDNPRLILNRLRSIFPLLAGYAALIIILVKVAQRTTPGFSIVGPLGLSIVYGLVGLAAATLSPQGTRALYWAGVYVSVPLVLWAVTWGGDSLGRAARLLNFNWFILVVIAVILFVIALLYIDLGAEILKPSAWPECNLYGTWFKKSSEYLRATGVGRFAAIAGIIAIARILQGNWRLLWIPILVGAMMLLVSSGARTAFMGFGVAAILIIFLYGGRRSALALAGLVVVGLILTWPTGVLHTFSQSCVLSRGVIPSPISGDAVFTPPPPSNNSTTQAPMPTRLATPALSTLEAPESTPSTTPVLTTSEAPASIPLATPAQATLEAPVPTQTKTIAQTLAKPQQTSEPLEPNEEPTPSAADSPEPSIIPTGSPSTATTPITGHKPESSGQPQSTPVETSNSSNPDAMQPGAASGTNALAPVNPPILVNPPQKPIPLYTLTGRTRVWVEGLKLFKDSPVLGKGFHADRFVLGEHIHNTFIHSLVQTGILGAVPLLIALVYIWFLFVAVMRKIAYLPESHKHLIILAGGMLGFLSVRSIPESTGAFFGVDWLILAPLLIYLQVANESANSAKRES